MKIPTLTAAESQLTPDINTRLAKLDAEFERRRAKTSYVTDEQRCKLRQGCHRVWTMPAGFDADAFVEWVTASGVYHAVAGNLSEFLDFLGAEQPRVNAGEGGAKAAMPTTAPSSSLTVAAAATGSPTPATAAVSGVQVGEVSSPERSVKAVGTEGTPLRQTAPPAPLATTRSVPRRKETGPILHATPIPSAIPKKQNPPTGDTADRSGQKGPSHDSTTVADPKITTVAGNFPASAASQTTATPSLIETLDVAAISVDTTLQVRVQL